MTCGPWRGVRLETYHARVADVRVDYSVGSDLKSVSGDITASVEGSSGKHVKFSITLADKVVFEKKADVDGDGIAKVSFQLDQVELWYPHGYGEQPLYTFKATTTTGDRDLHTATRKTGFRRGELIQEPDDVGKTFFFRVNGVDIFCGGSDWIPADSFTPRITAERYRKWLQTLVDGYQVMVRYVSHALDLKSPI